MNITAVGAERKEQVGFLQQLRTRLEGTRLNSTLVTAPGTQENSIT